MSSAPRQSALSRGARERIRRQRGPRTAQTWAPTVTGPEVLTPTLESLLLARIDSLPVHCHRLAQLAAVIGRSFPLRVLEQISDSDELDAEVTTLVRADIVRELRRYPEPEYIFRHGLLQQASLSTLPPTRRRALHREVAVAYETVFSSSPDHRLNIIAHHYARSDDLAKALDYLDRAGERAATLGAGQSAEELWGRGLKAQRSWETWSGPNVFARAWRRSTVRSDGKPMGQRLRPESGRAGSGRFVLTTEPTAARLRSAACPVPPLSGAPRSKAVMQRLFEWECRCAASEEVHFDVAEQLSRRNLFLGIPAVVLSAIVGTSLFVSVSGDGVADGIRIAAGTVSLIAGVLASIQTFLRFGARAEQHRVAAERWAAVKREIEKVRGFAGGTGWRRKRAA